MSNHTDSATKDAASTGSTNGPSAAVTCARCEKSDASGSGWSLERNGDRICPQCCVEAGNIPEGVHRYWCGWCGAWSDIKENLAFSGYLPTGWSCTEEGIQVCGKCGLSKRSQSDGAVNHPAHYNSHPSGVECITIVEHMSFNIGNAIKYLWREGHKGAPLDDLKKAIWYIQREIERRGKATKP